MTLASSFRIKNSKRIEEVKLNGKLYQNPNFGVCILKREDDDVPKFAFVVSTKVSKGAVHRNRITRSLNEGVRRSLYKIPKGIDFVFLAKRSLDTKTTEVIIREVEIFFSEHKFKNE